MTGKLPIQRGNLFALPILHYTMELACSVRFLFNEIKPDCVAVELPFEYQETFIHAASRLPDISVVIHSDDKKYFLAEPCDPTFEAIRSALENQIPAYCIDCDVENYPLIDGTLPDPYAITKIGLEEFYNAYRNSPLCQKKVLPQDEKRELFMAKKLKELSLCYERVLFIGGFFHIERILSHFEKNSFPEEKYSLKAASLATLTEESCRENLSEYGYLTSRYESWRRNPQRELLDRQKILLDLYKEAGDLYSNETGFPFEKYHLSNLMKFSRNYALYTNRLMPNLFMILQAAKGCVDHNYAYEVWKLATNTPFLKNIDSLQELNLSVEELWGHSRKILFNLKQKQKKGSGFSKRQKDLPHCKIYPPSPFSICSFPPEDVAVEKFGSLLKKKCVHVFAEEKTQVVPFKASLEDGIDVKETVRHFYEKRLYVKILGKPKAAIGSVCVIFDEDIEQIELFPWKTTWIGEHEQESDMAFFATEMTKNVVGPGISRCQYGGFLLSYPPRRLWDIWMDPDYVACKNKAEVLLCASIDYSRQPVIAYVAKKPPSSRLKNYAERFGKKIAYTPLGSLSPSAVNQIRIFHVLEGQDKREIAGDYIF